MRRAAAARPLSHRPEASLALSPGSFPLPVLFDFPFKKTPPPAPSPVTLAASDALIPATCPRSGQAHGRVRGRERLPRVAGPLAE